MTEKTPGKSLRFSKVPRVRLTGDPQRWRSRVPLTPSLFVGRVGNPTTTLICV